MGRKKTRRGSSAAVAAAGAKNVKRLKTEEGEVTQKAVEDGVPGPSTSSDFAGEQATGSSSPSVTVSVEDGGGGDEDGPPQVGAGGRLFNHEHPMLNPMLLMKVIGYYNPNIEDFKILRQVCKLWHDVTFDLWRSKFVLRLTEEKEVFRERKDGGISVGEFLKRFEDPDDPFQLASQPYSKYTFTELTIDMHICDKEGSESKRFWDGVGPLMEYLHFNRCFFPTGQYMAFEQLLLEKVPNLEALVITDTGKVTLPSSPSDSPYAQVQRQVERMQEMKARLLDDHLNLKRLKICGSIPVKLRKLVAKFPNLEDLQIRSSVHSSASYEDSVMDVLIFLRKQRLQSNHTKYNLKILDLMHTKVFYSWFSITRVLNQVHFPLETLGIEIKPDQSLNHQALKPLLEHHAATLKTLKVFCPPLSNTIFHDTFPFDVNLQNLEELQLWGNAVRSFKFLKFAPNLKRLLINRYCVEKWEEVISHQKEISQFGWLHPNQRTYILPFTDDMVDRAVRECDMRLVEARSLEALRVDFEFSEASLRTLKEWMPNLTTLRTVLTKSSFSAVCDLWPNLRNLRAMFQSELDDEALTGWSFDGDQPKEQLPVACLTDLKDLRKFQLDTLCSKSKITDKTAIYGLMQLKRLDAIHVCVSPKFTSATEELLKKQIPFVRLIRNYGKKPHCETDKEIARAGVCCFHKKFFETVQSDEELHRRRENALEAARERRLRQLQAQGQRQQRPVDIIEISSSSSSSDSSSDSSSSDEGDDDDFPRLRRIRPHRIV